MKKQSVTTVIFGTAAVSTVILAVLAGLDHPFLDNYLEILGFVFLILAGLYIFKVFLGKKGELVSVIKERPTLIGIGTALLIYVSGFLLDEYKNGIFIKVGIFILGFVIVYAHKNFDDNSSLKSLIKKFMYGVVLTLVVVTISIAFLAIIYGTYLNHNG